MKYLSFGEWKKEYHWDTLTKCKSDCTWCHLIGGPGWHDWDYCEAYDVSLIANYHNNGGKLLCDTCDTCDKFEPKNDYQLYPLYREYVDHFCKNDPEREYAQAENDFEEYELRKDLGLICSEEVTPVSENFPGGDN